MSLNNFDKIYLKAEVCTEIGADDDVEKIYRLHLGGNICILMMESDMVYLKGDNYEKDEVKNVMMPIEDLTQKLNFKAGQKVKIKDILGGEFFGTIHEVDFQNNTAEVDFYKLCRQRYSFEDIKIQEG